MDFRYTVHPWDMNRDAGSYQLSHTWDHVISRSCAPSSYKQSRRDQDVWRTLKRCHYVTYFQWCELRSFYVTDCTNWMNLFNTVGFWFSTNFIWRPKADASSCITVSEEQGLPIFLLAFGRMVWLPDSENNLKICLFVLTECTNMTDTRTHTQTHRVAKISSTTDSRRLAWKFARW